MLVSGGVIVGGRGLRGIAGHLHVLTAGEAAAEIVAGDARIGAMSAGVNLHKSSSASGVLRV